MYRSEGTRLGVTSGESSSALDESRTAGQQRGPVTPDAGWTTPCPVSRLSRYVTQRERGIMYLTVRLTPWAMERITRDYLKSDRLTKAALKASLRDMPDTEFHTVATPVSR